MRTTMMPPPATPETLSTSPTWLTEVTSQALDAFGVTDHTDLFATDLEGESDQERAGRLAAAADILDDRLTEIAHTTLTSEVIRGWSA